MNKIYYNLEQFNKDVIELSNKIKKQYTAICGVPRGGIPLALALSNQLGITLVQDTNHCDTDTTLVVDDLVDSGRTRDRYRHFDFACLHVKHNTPAKHYPTYYIRSESDWIVYWWEGSEEASIEDNVVRMLQYIGVDVTDANFCDTPARVARSYEEILEGYLPEAKDELKKHLSKTFPCDSDQMIVIKDILCWSMCPHHLLPVKYNISMAYIPKDKVLGASKLPRVAILLAKRLVLQEQLVTDIADFIEQHAEPYGVAIYAEGQHMCMQMRGIKSQSTFITSALRGVYKGNQNKNIAARAELMSLIKNG